MMRPDQAQAQALVLQTLLHLGPHQLSRLYDDYMIGMMSPEELAQVVAALTHARFVKGERNDSGDEVVKLYSLTRKGTQFAQTL